MAGANPLTLDAVRAAVTASLPTAAPIAICLGGGADSAVLAWASRREGARAVFVHHELAASDHLAAAAAAVADEVGLELTIVAAPVDEGPSLEGRARNARITALGSFRGEAEWLATGHSADDQAETVLAHLLRGSGATGLAGIAPNRFPWVRPLLGFSRADLRAVAAELALPFVDDPANTDVRHLRNRIRLELIPNLESRYNPRLRQALARTAAVLAADDAELSRVADAVVISDRFGATLLPIPVLATLPPPIAARVVRRAMRRFHDPYSGSHSDVARILDLATTGSGRETLSGGVTAVVEGPYIAVHTSPLPPPDPVRLQVPGAVPWAEWSLETSRPAPGSAVPASSSLLEPALAREGLQVRPAVAGDRIALRAGSKLVRDALAEAGVPARLRPVWPVITVGAKIAAVPAVRVAPWARPAGPDAVAVTMIERGRT